MKFFKFLILCSVLIITGCGGVSLTINDNPAPNYIVFGNLPNGIHIIAYAMLNYEVIEGKESYVAYKYIRTAGTVQLPATAKSIVLCLQIINPKKIPYKIIRQLNYVKDDIRYMEVNTVYNGKLSRNNLIFTVPVQNDESKIKIELDTMQTIFPTFDLAYKIQYRKGDDIENQLSEY